MLGRVDLQIIFRAYNFACSALNTILQIHEMEFLIILDVYLMDFSSAVPDTWYFIST